MVAAFDFLRALAVLLVVYGHVIGYATDGIPFLGPLASYITPLTYEQRVKLLFVPYVNVGEIAVAIFFLLSGFLITKSREGKNTYQFLVKRCMRIFPIAIVGTVMVFFLLNCVNAYYFGTRFTLNTSDILFLVTNSLLINDLIPCQSSGNLFQSTVLMPHFWFLGVIVKYYILMAILRKYGQKVLMVCGLVLLLASCIYIIFKGESLVSHYLAVLAFSSHHILFILIGSSLYYLMGDYVFKLKPLSSFNQIGYVSSLIALFILSFYVLRKDIAFPIPADMLKNYFIALLIFFFVLLLSPKVTVSPYIVKLLSKTSFSTYVLHYSLGAVLVYLLLKVDVFTRNLMLTYLVTFIVVFLFGFLLYHFVEQPFAKMQFFNKSKRVS